MLATSLAPRSLRIPVSEEKDTVIEYHHQPPLASINMGRSMNQQTLISTYISIHISHIDLQVQHQNEVKSSLSKVVKLMLVVICKMCKRIKFSLSLVYF